MTLFYSEKRNSINPDFAVEHCILFEKENSIRISLNPDFAVGIVMKGASVRQIWTPRRKVGAGSTAFRTAVPAGRQGSIAYAMLRNEKRGRS